MSIEAIGLDRDERARGRLGGRPGGATPDPGRTMTGCWTPIRTRWSGPSERVSPSVVHIESFHRARAGDARRAREGAGERLGLRLHLQRLHPDQQPRRPRRRPGRGDPGRRQPATPPT